MKNGSLIDALKRWDNMSAEEQADSEKKSYEANKIAFAEQNREYKALRHRAVSSLSSEDVEDCRLDKLTIVDQNRDVIKILSQWNPSKTHKGILLHGTVGTGKSLICKCLVNKWATGQYICRFIRIGDLMDILKDAISETAESVSYHVAKFTKYDLLVLDDLGTENASDWTYEKLFTILDDRIAQKKHTFITTNLGPSEFSKRYGSRVLDRIKMSCRIFPMKGTSFREIMNNNNEW